MTEMNCDWLEHSSASDGSSSSPSSRRSETQVNNNNNNNNNIVYHPLRCWLLCRDPLVPYHWCQNHLDPSLTDLCHSCHCPDQQLPSVNNNKSYIHTYMSHKQQQLTLSFFKYVRLSSKPITTIVFTP